MSSRRPPLASHASFNDDVDDAALDDLLGSDTESVSSRLNRGKPRLSPAAASTASASRGPAARQHKSISASQRAADTAKGDWDDESDADKSPGSDDIRPASSSRRPPSRPLPSRNRALPTKKPSAAASHGGPTGSTTADLDSALFGLGGGAAGGGGGSAVRSSTLSAPGEEDAPVQRPKSRSRTLLEARDDEDDRPVSAASSGLEDKEDDWDAPSTQKGKTDEKRAEDSRPARTRPRSGLSIDDTVSRHLAHTTKQQQQDEEPRQPASSSTAPSDDVSDRRARYRETMQKRKQERASLSVPNPASPPAGPLPKAAPPQPADDPWSTLDDPLSSIGDQPSAADRIAQSLAAFGSGAATAKEEPMPMARTQPLDAVAEDSGSLLGGRRPRALAGRRAAGLSASPASISDDPLDQPTTAPALSTAAANAAPLPAVLKVEVTAAELPPPHTTLPRPHTASAASTSASTAFPTPSPFASIATASPSAPSFSSWCQWLGLDAAFSADQPLLAIARRAAAQPLPAHITHRDGAWHNSRTGRQSAEHPALGKWRKRLEQKQLAIKYNVDDDDSDEDADSFWRDVDEQQQETEERKQQQQLQQQQQQQQQPQSISSQVAAVMSPTLAALASSSFSSRPPTASAPPAASFAHSALPTFMTNSIAAAAPHTQSSPSLTAFSLPPPATSAAASPPSSVVEEALAQQRTALTREFQQQLADAVSHQMQVSTLTSAQRAKEDEDRRRRDDERHRREVAALREQLYDSRVMRGLTDSIEAGVKGVEELREKASEDKKQREEEWEQAYKLRDELLTQRERAVEQSVAHYSDKRKQAETEAQVHQREAEALRQEKATLQSSLQAEREELRLQRRQLQTEKELLMAEKDKYISESSRWERERAEQHDMVSALREMIERKHRQADEELQRARDDRAAIVAQLDGDKEEARLQRELLNLRRRRLDEDENKLQTARDELALKEAEVSEQVAMVQRLGLQLNRQSTVLVNERRQLDDERRHWDAQEQQQLSLRASKRSIETPYSMQALGEPDVVDSGSRGHYTPTVFFAPFLASLPGLRVDRSSELSAADLKLLECESEMTGVDGGEMGWSDGWTNATVAYENEQHAG